MDTSRGVRLVEQTSDTRCVQGENWGVDRRGVWVDQGCAGRFVAGRGDDSHRPRDSMPDRLNDACVREVVQRLRIGSRDVRAGRGRPADDGLFEIIVRTPDGVYLCTVNARGRVRDVTRR